MNHCSVSAKVSLGIPVCFHHLDLENKMHLAVVTPFQLVSVIGQYGNFVTRLLCQSGAFRHVSVLTERVGYLPPIEPLPQLTIERIWQRDDIHAGLKATARLRCLRPDVIWYNVALSGFSRLPLINLINLLQMSLVRPMKIPYVITLHELAEQADLRALGAPHGKIARTVAKLLTLVITRADVVCATLRCYAQLLNPRRPNTRIVHIPLGAHDHPQILPETECKSLLVCAMIAPFKGIEVLLSAFQELLTLVPSVRLTIAGAEHLRFPGYLSYLRDRYDSISSVRWTGYVPEDGLQELFRQATAVVLPYTACTGSSSTLYRAVTWGRPIVASDLTELQATADEEGLQANYFRQGDVEHLTATLFQVLSNPSLRREQVEHNYHICLDHLTPEHTCCSYIQAFNLALKAHQSCKYLSLPANHNDITLCGTLERSS